MSACLGRSVAVLEQTRFQLATCYLVETAALLTKNLGPVGRAVSLDRSLFRFLLLFSFCSADPSFPRAN